MVGDGSGKWELTMWGWGNGEWELTMWGVGTGGGGGGCVLAVGSGEWGEDLGYGSGEWELAMWEGVVESWNCGWGWWNGEWWPW